MLKNINLKVRRIRSPSPPHWALVFSESEKSMFSSLLVHSVDARRARGRLGGVVHLYFLFFLFRQRGLVRSSRIGDPFGLGQAWVVRASVDLTFSSSALRFSDRLVIHIHSFHYALCCYPCCTLGTQKAVYVCRICRLWTFSWGRSEKTDTSQRSRWSAWSWPRQKGREQDKKAVSPTKLAFWQRAQLKALGVS